MAAKVSRIIPYLEADGFEDVADFYTGVLGLEVAMELEDYLGLGSPSNRSAQIVVARTGAEQPLPHMGIDVGDPAAVDAAHAECRRRGLEIVYPLTDEPWGVRRFFVRDPSGRVISVLAHGD
jgi:catechol 2,3-dioxygenase-like lactoylglutathione lyase family enzyme